MSTRKQQREAAARKAKEAKLERRKKLWDSFKRVGLCIINLVLIVSCPLWIGFVVWAVILADLIRDRNDTQLLKWLSGEKVFLT